MAQPIWGDEQAFKVRGKPAPAKAPCIANSRWKGNRLLTPAGGGVDIQPAQAFEPRRLMKDEKGQLYKAHQRGAKLPAGRWWWD